MENLKELAKLYFETFSNQDLVKLKDFFDQEIVLRDWEINAKGIEEVLKANKLIFESLETIHVKTLKIYQDDFTIIGDLEININNSEKILVVDIITFNHNQKIKSIYAYKGN